MLEVAFPYRLDDRGRTATAQNDDHIEQMLELLLFTRPGERVNRPDFGSGLMQPVFAPNSPELAATLQFTMQAAIQRWLGDVIALQTLSVSSDDASLIVDIEYVVLRSNVTQTQRFVRPLV